jgi:RimJ/RimL family protein N-acetyltransferase
LESALHHLSLRPLNHADFPLLQRWLSAAHIIPWWGSSPDLAAVQAKYAPRVEGREPTHVFIVNYHEQAIGLIQWYRWSDYPEHARQLGAERTSAGIDLALGEKERLGMGLGPAAIKNCIEKFIFVHSDINAILSDIEEDNIRSLRAFEKVGFVGTQTIRLKDEKFLRRILRLDRPDPDDASPFAKNDS